MPCTMNHFLTVLCAKTVSHGDFMNFSKKFIRANGNMCDFNCYVPSPYLRRKFIVDFPADHACITICGLGFYRLWINGIEITKGSLAPYISNTGDICYYDNYNITELLISGENVIGVQLGNGFRNPFGGFIWDFEKMESRGPVCMAVSAEIYGLGKNILFEADERFVTHPSPVIFDDLRMGCRYDARLEIDGWNLPGFDDGNWQPAEICDAPKGNPKLCTVSPIVNLREIMPASVKHFDSLPFDCEITESGNIPNENTIRHNVYVFDFGINTAGITKLHINGIPGQKITIRHAERMLDEGIAVCTTLFKFNKEIYEKYLDYGQVDEYICRGGDEWFIPMFKYDGFRYAYVEGLNADQITEDTLVYIEQSSAMVSRADFESSDEALNKLFEYSRRSDRSNFFYFPTDCPHREKNGWTGDASVSSEQFLLNFKVTPLLKEWLCNIRAAQREDGDLPGIIPTGGWGFDGANGPAWDSVCVNLPYYIYKFDADASVIKENAEMILKYFRYMLTRLDERGLADFGLGDWLDPFSESSEKINTPLAVTSTAMLYDIENKAAHLFSECGMANAENEVRQYAEKLRTAFRKYLIDFDTMLVSGTHQTAQSVAIAVGMFDKSEITEAQKKLVEIIHRDGDINTCGMIGLRYIFHVLTDAGETELAYKIITGHTFSCYGYWLDNNATSLWEWFIPMNKTYSSQNHHFLGDISSWMVQCVTGICPNPDANDIKSFTIAPHFISQLSFARGSYCFTEGKLDCKWERMGSQIAVSLNVPAGLNGKLILPEGFCLLDGRKKLELKNGKYVFTVKRNR